ncbi:MAG: hypothetical protein AB7D16_12220 [Eubacteriaceae bacterium]
MFRIIEVSGGTKLDHLHKIITNAFDFDDEHLYMFSQKRKKYDSDGYYAPGSGAGGHSAARTRLNELGLKPRNKILFLYDFGDEWEFDVLVSKITEVDKKISSQVIESQGQLEQYEDWDDEDEDWEDEYDLLEDLPEDCDVVDLLREMIEPRIPEGDEDLAADISVWLDGLQSFLNMPVDTNALYQADFYQVERSELSQEELLAQDDSEKLALLLDAMNIQRPEDQGFYAKALMKQFRCQPDSIFDLLMAEDILFLQELLNKDYHGFMIGLEIRNPVWHLHALGLLNIGIEDICFFELTDELDALAEALARIDRDLEKECELEQISQALINLYQVIESNRFRQMVSDLVDWEVTDDYFENFVIRKLSFWNQDFYQQDQAGNSYFTCCSAETMAEVLANREKYKVRDYKKFDPQYCLELIRDGKEVSIWCTRLKRELKPKVGDIFEIEEIVSDLEDLLRIGGDQEVFLNQVMEKFDEMNISMTQKLMDTLRKMYENYPSGGLKGHNWHDNSRDNGSDQLSMFGDQPLFSI